MATPTGFGSWKIDIAVVVQKPFDQILTKQDWKVVSSDEASTTFSYSYKNRKRGDDEMALFEVGHGLPEWIPMEFWKIDWDRSDY